MLSDFDPIKKILIFDFPVIKISFFRRSRQERFTREHSLTERGRGGRRKGNTDKPRLFYSDSYSHITFSIGDRFIPKTPKLWAGHQLSEIEGALTPHLEP